MGLSPSSEDSVSSQMSHALLPFCSAEASKETPVQITAISSAISHSLYSSPTYASELLAVDGLGHGSILTALFTRNRQHRWRRKVSYQPGTGTQTEPMLNTSLSMQMSGKMLH